MNKQGQMASVGTLISLFVGIVVVMALLTGSIFPTIGSMTDTVSVANTSLTSVVNGTPQYLTNYRAISSVVIINATNSTGGTGAIPIIGSGNYTVDNNVVYNGVLSVKITPNTTADYKYAWKVSGTAEPLTYDENGGSRTIIELIAIFAALAVAVFTISPTMREKIFDAF